jgi:hypothetical protein
LLAFPFYEASSNQALPSLLGSPVCRWTGTPMHCSNKMNSTYHNLLLIMSVQSNDFHQE